jgi:hypothetical protein
VDELDTQSFVVRFWVEERDAKSGQTTWRGHITHVATGERQYVQKLGEVNEFIIRYLGVQLSKPMGWRGVYIWLGRYFQKIAESKIT